MQAKLQFFPTIEIGWVLFWTFVKFSYGGWGARRDWHAPALSHRADWVLWLLRAFPLLRAAPIW